MKTNTIKPQVMKKLVLLLLLFTGMVNAQIVNIPDANFKAKLIALGVDANTDGNIQVSEALVIYSLDVSNSSIADLTGILNFTNLNVLFCGNNLIPNLNLTGMSNLQSLNCSSNQLTSLNLTNVTNLNQLDCSNNQLPSLNGISNSIVHLYCQNNRLTSFNATNLNNLTELNCSNNRITSFSINSAPNLYMLDCNSNLITSIDLNNFSNLSTFDCSNNKLSVLNISNLSALQAIYCKVNPELTTVNLNNLSNLQVIDLTGNSVVGNGTNVPIDGNITNLSLTNLPQLYSLNCSYNKIASLNLNNLSSLNYLDCTFNQLTDLSLTNLPNLTSLSCYVNKFQTLDVSNLSALNSLRCGSGYYVGNQLTDVLQNINIAGLSNLNWFECFDTLITNLDLTGLTNLERFYFSGIHNAGVLSSLNVNGLLNLKYLTCSDAALTTLDVSNLVNLEDLNCSFNLISNLSLNGLLHLKTLNYSFNYLTDLSLTNLPLLESLSCNYNQLTSLNVNNLTSLKSLFCTNNYLTTLNLNGLTELVNLDFSDNNLGLANISGISPNLVSLGCAFNNLTSIDISGFPALESLYCRNNQLTTLNLATANNLKYLDFQSNQISTINLSNLNNLVQLECSSNLLTNIDVSNLTNLWTLQFENNQISSLNLSNNQLLEILSYSQNPLPNFNLNSVPSLKGVSCYDTQTSVLDVSNLVNLEYIYCDNNLLQSLDVSNCQKLNNIFCTNNQLTTLFIKNGKNEAIIDFSNNPTLQYICADTDQLYSIQTQLNSLGMNATVSNSYCSFTPGGNHNTISGLTIFDADNNGCDVTDEVNPFIRLDINDGLETGSTVTNINGSYNYYTNAGNYTITPNVENPTWFDFSPPSANFNFPDNNNNISSQDFCIQSIGTHSDVEVVLAPISFARPGFDATYKIVFKNKGNQMQSGTVTLNFDDARIDFVSSSPSVNATATNLLSWNYVNLMPFENRSIFVTLNVNSPTETPAVNIGNILNYAATINPVGTDENPNDNTFAYNQIVVGSFDPNEITCLEGDSVSTSEIGNYLHYMINFENTGNFPAENIVVKDIIDESVFDVSSLQILNSSDAVTARITGNVAEFIFKNIMLEGGGHGNILIKIKTKPTLQTGAIASKSADIFFDYNAPVDTGMANTTFTTLSNSVFEIDNSISVYPNPTNSKININCNNKIQSVELYDVQGRILQTVIGNTSKIDISEKSKGIYFLKIISDKGSKVEKIVKE